MYDGLYKSCFNTVIYHYILKEKWEKTGQNQNTQLQMCQLTGSVRWSGVGCHRLAIYLPTRLGTAPQWRGNTPCFCKNFLCRASSSKFICSVSSAVYWINDSSSQPFPTPLPWGFPPLTHLGERTGLCQSRSEKTLIQCASVLLIYLTKTYSLKRGRSSIWWNLDSIKYVQF